VELPACQPGPGWWKKEGLAMSEQVQNKRDWRAKKAGARLAALTPRPRVNLVLYYGVLAPRAR
jgi:hypothetical protein